MSEPRDWASIEREARHAAEPMSWGRVARAVGFVVVVVVAAVVFLLIVAVGSQGPGTL